jgi:hypothetical protein
MDQIRAVGLLMRARLGAGRMAVSDRFVVKWQDLVVPSQVVASAACR